MADQKDKGIFRELYGENNESLAYQSRRFKKLATKFVKIFKTDPYNFFSTPGRTEIGGNHTDHNHGLVLAAAVNLDTIAAAHPVTEKIVTVSSEGYPDLFVIPLAQLDAVSGEKGTTAALIRGIASKISDAGFRIGGFHAHIASDVLIGSGLSSSASIEMMIANIFNYFYNDGKIPLEEMARIAQFAENIYFGKPCGLMDQIACAAGGIVKIDFEDPQDPVISRVNFDFDSAGYGMIIVNTGGNHAALTEEYASIPEEMKSVASFYHKKVCRELNPDQVFNDIALLRKSAGDRALLRVFHFFRENERVTGMVRSLESGDIDCFLQLVNQSGDSSFKWLQNIYTSKNAAIQGISLALALTEEFIDSRKITGAYRVHGGGFAGTIQAVLPSKYVNEYKIYMNTIFGDGAAIILKIRKQGSCFLGNLDHENTIN